MKKLIAMALSFVLALSVTACAKEQKTEYTDFGVLAALQDMLNQVEFDDTLILREEDMLDFFGIKAENMETFAAVTCSNGISAQEIVLVKAVDEDSAEVVMEKLTNRLDARSAEAENYLPDQFAIIKECKVQRHGVYVALIIHPEHEKLENLYMDYLLGNK